MKKLLLLSLALMLSLSVLMVNAEGSVNVTAMNGPTAMGMVQLMDQNEQGKIENVSYNFSIVKAIDEVVAGVAKGNIDIATVPANLASVLYNNTKGKVQVLAINTLGVLYIAENGTAIQTLADLKGKTIYASGKGATPEYALNYILAKNGLKDDVTIEWKSEQAEVVAALNATENAIAMLPQPFATTALIKNASLRVALDMTKEWEATDSEGALVTGVVIVNKAFAQENKDVVADFMSRYQTSVQFANEDVAGAAKLIGQYGIVPEPVAKKALPACNIVCISGEELKPMLTGYLKELFDQNPKSVGGQLPDDAFFYQAQ